MNVCLGYVMHGKVSCVLFDLSWAAFCTVQTFPGGAYPFKRDRGAPLPGFSSMSEYKNGLEY